MTCARGPLRQHVGKVQIYLHRSGHVDPTHLQHPGVGEPLPGRWGAKMDAARDVGRTADVLPARVEQQQGVRPDSPKRGGCVGIGRA